MKIFKFLLTACFLFYSALGIEANEFEGIGAGASVTTGYYNMAIGQFALTSMTTGYRNVAAGERAGFSLTTGYGNILLGAFAGYSLTTDVNKLYITNMPSAATGIFGDFTTGYFGVNNTSPSVAWDVVGNAKISGSLSNSVFIYSIAVADSIMTVANIPSGGIITNGAAANPSDIVLPTAVAGLIYTFVTTDTDSMNIIASSGDNIDHASATNQANYCAVGQIGESVTLVALDNVSWQVIASTGTWGTK